MISSNWQGSTWGFLERATCQGHCPYPSNTTLRLSSIHFTFYQQIIKKGISYFSTGQKKTYINPLRIGIWWQWKGLPTRIGQPCNPQGLKLSALLPSACSGNDQPTSTSQSLTAASDDFEHHNIWPVTAYITYRRKDFLSWTSATRRPFVLLGFFHNWLKHNIDQMAKQCVWLSKSGMKDTNLYAKSRRTILQ